MTPTESLLHTLVDSFEVMYMPIDITHTQRYIYIYVWHRWATCGCPWGCACVWLYIRIHIYIYICACMHGTGGAHEPHISTPVHQAPLCLPAGPEGAGQLVTFARARPLPRLDSTTPNPAPRRGASHRANSAGQLATALPHGALTCAPPPASLPSSALSLPCPSPVTLARAGSPPLPACLPACLSGRARLRRPFSYTYPPTSTGPPSCVQTFRGPKVVPGEAHLRGQTARLPPGHVPRPTGDRPSSPGGGARAPEEWTTGRARTTISARQLVCTHGGGDPREPVVAGPPASPEKGVWPPSKRPALPDPLMGGVCQQI
jgi:hypothetical protein